MRHLVERLTYANVASTLAVGLALAGGTALAAATIGAKDIKPNAVRAKHIKSGQVKAAEFAALNGKLRRGQTLRGTYAVAGRKAVGDSNSSVFLDASPISYGFQLARSPEFHLVEVDASDPACPGTAERPRAKPGRLCVYEVERLRTGRPRLGLSTPGGATLEIQAGGSAGQSYAANGTWAVSAP